MAYKNPTQAQDELTSAFSPTTDAQQQAISQAAALVPGAPVPSPIQPKRTIDPGVDAAESFLGKFTAPESAADIAERKRQQSSGLIDSINKTYDDQVASQRKVGDERLAMDNAISVMSGLMGATEASRTHGKTVEGNDKEIQAINNKRMLDLSGIYTKISQDADVEARQQLTDATKSAEDILARRTANQSKAVDNLKLMASSGLVDFDSFKSSPANAKVFQYALDSVGGSEDALKGLFALNRPKETVLDKKWVGSKLYQVYQNPVTGKTRSEVVDLGFDVPPSYTTEVDLGDRIMLLDPNDPTKQLVFSKGLTPKDRQDASAAGGDAAKERLNEALTLAQDLRSDTATGKGSAVGASVAKLVPFGQALGWQGNRTAFEAKVNTLKANLTLDNLKLLKGAMSDKDLMFLNSVGSSLDTSMTEQQFNGELDRIIKKLETSTGTSSGSIVTAPDGTQVELID